MEVKEPVLALDPMQISWPEHLGVAGIGRRAAAAPVGEGGRRALAALHAWLPELDADTATAELVAAVRPKSFPYGEVLVHYQGVGRTQAATGVTGWLRRLDSLMQMAGPAGGRRLWPLPEWLPSTIDQHAGNYDTYLVARLLESVTGHGGAGEQTYADVDRATDWASDEATDRSIDLLVAALVADLALIEGDALRLAPQCRQQRHRTQGCLLVLSKLADLAPKWVPAGAATWTSKRLVSQFDGRPANDPTGAVELAECTTRLALDVRHQVPEPHRLAVDLSLLPTTPLHDEQMFIRCIQVFETLYRQVYRCLLRAGAAVRALDVQRACAELADATSRLRLSPVLYRVVTTMPRATFAIIRDYTNGRSAIQSRSYRQIDLVCAPRPPSPVAEKLPAVEVARPTLQEAFLAALPRLDATEADLLAAHVRGLDASWRAMKRTHWGVTLKIIGRVPGTGGTAGAEYLERAAAVPLFPALVPRLAELPR